MNRLSFSPTKTLAVLVGNGSFEEYTGSSLTPIPPAINNIDDFESVLTEKSIIGIPPGNIIRMVDFTRTQLMTKLNDLLKQRKHKHIDTVIFYYIGHGLVDLNRKYYLAAKDSNPYLIEDTAVPFAYVKSKLSKVSRAIVIIDACRSGLATLGNGILDPVDGTFDMEGAYTLTCCSDWQEPVFDPRERNTDFTGVLLQFLKAGKDEPKPCLNLEDVYYHVFHHDMLKSTPWRSNGFQAPQEFGICFNRQFNDETAGRFFSTGKFDKALQWYTALNKHGQFNKYDEQIRHCRERLYQEAMELGEEELELKQYSSALKAFFDAYTISPNPNVHTRIEECKRLMKEAEINGGSPTVVFFETDRTHIFQGDSITLSWQVHQADIVQLNDDIGSVSQSGSMKISPAMSKTYRLTALNAKGACIPAEQTITVYKAPQLDRITIREPDLSRLVNLDTLLIAAPRVNVSIAWPLQDGIRPGVSTSGMVRIISTIKRNYLLIINKILYANARKLL